MFGKSEKEQFESEKSRNCRYPVRENSLEMVEGFRYLGDVISCGGGVKSAVRDRIFCA